MQLPIFAPGAGACTAEARGHSGRVTALALSRSEELLASASEDGSVRLCSAETLRCHAVAAPSLDCSPVTAMALSKDCTELWTGCGDGHLRRFRLGPAGFSRVACLNLNGVVGSSQYRLPGCVPANLSSAVGTLVGAAHEKLFVVSSHPPPLQSCRCPPSLYMHVCAPARNLWRLAADECSSCALRSTL